MVGAPRRQGVPDDAEGRDAEGRRHPGRATRPWCTFVRPVESCRWSAAPESPVVLLGPHLCRVDSIGTRVVHEMTRPGGPEPAGTTRRRIGVPTPWTIAARERSPVGYGSRTLAVAASGPPANESHVKLPPRSSSAFISAPEGFLSPVRRTCACFPADRSATTRARAGCFGRSALFHVNHVVRQQNSDFKQTCPNARVVHPPGVTGDFVTVTNGSEFCSAWPSKGS